MQTRRSLFVSIDNLLWGLHQLNKDTSSRLWVDERDVVASRTLSNASRSEPNAFGSQVLDAGLEVVHPEPHVVECRDVHLGRLLRVQRLHQVDLHLMRPMAQREDVFVHILFLAHTAQRESREAD